MNVLLIFVFLILATYVALRRLFRGPKRRGWSWRHESMMEFMKWLGRRSSARGFAHLLAMLRGSKVPKTPILARVREQATLLGGLRATWFEPRTLQHDAVVYYVHGGGFVACSVETHRELMARLSLSAGCRVVGIDYRLAPEHPFPAALIDAVSGYRALLATGQKPAQVVIAGDSAGGGLVVSALVLLRDAGVPLPAAAVLLSPWVDLASHDPSMTANADFDYIGGLDEVMQQVAAVYAGQSGATHPLVSPIFADLSGLPPLLIHVGGAEVLLDQAERFACRAREAGVEVQLEVWEDMVHVWHSFATVFPESKEALRHVGHYIKVRTRPAVPDP